MIQPIIKANALTTINEGSESELSQVVLYQDSSKTIISLVDKKQVESYKKDILTNSNFKQQEINKIKLTQQGLNKNNVALSTLPTGQIMSQSYLYRSGIQSTVDRYAGNGTFAKLLSNPITDATVGALIKAAKFANPWAVAATALSWMAGDLMNRQQSWWNQSLLMILKKQISCVRVTHIRNTTSDYPATYLIIERL